MHDITKTIQCVSKEDCCGCRACEQTCPKKCIRMTVDREGFLYPTVDDCACIECSKCLKVCPQIKQTKQVPLHVYGVKAKDQKTQYASASGGVFTTLASNALDAKYVVFGSAYTEEFNSAQHVHITSKEQLPVLQSSKYVQSDTEQTYSDVERILKEGGQVLYAGMACQIQGLLNYLRKDYDNLITIDIVCHGVPSPLLFKDYMSYITKKYGTVTGINMRDKRNGWEHPYFNISVAKEVSAEDAKIWPRIFYNKQALRPSCYNCKFCDTKRCGDLTIGDFWGIEKHHPDFYDEKGVSLIFLNTAKGGAFFEKYKDSFNCIDSCVEKCIQPNLQKPTERDADRAEFWQRYFIYGFHELVAYYYGIYTKSQMWLKMNRYINNLIKKNGRS